MGLSIRIAHNDDAGVLATLRRDWTEENSGEPIEDAAFEPAFLDWWEDERGTRTFFLAELGDVAVGMANVKRYRQMPRPGVAGGTWGYVGNVFIRAEHRNAGLGAALMQHIVMWARTEQFAHLRLAPSRLSRPLYERLGFRPGAVLELGLGEV